MLVVVDFLGWKFDPSAAPDCERAHPVHQGVLARNLPVDVGHQRVAMGGHPDKVEFHIPKIRNRAIGKATAAQNAVVLGHSFEVAGPRRYYRVQAQTAVLAEARAAGRSKGCERLLGGSEVGSAPVGSAGTWDQVQHFQSLGRKVEPTACAWDVAGRRRHYDHVRVSMSLS